MRNEHEEHPAADELLRGVPGVYTEAGIQSLENRDRYYCERIGDGLTPLMWDQQSVCPESVGVTTLAELERLAGFTKRQKEVARLMRKYRNSVEKTARVMGRTESAVYKLISRMWLKVRASFARMDDPHECQMVARLMDREEDLPSPEAMRLFDSEVRYKLKSIYRKRKKQGRLTAWRGGKATTPGQKKRRNRRQRKR